MNLARQEKNSALSVSSQVILFDKPRRLEHNFHLSHVTATIYMNCGMKNIIRLNIPAWVILSAKPRRPPVMAGPTVRLVWGALLGALIGGLIVLLARVALGV
jgi:hypothetical protein